VVAFKKVLHLCVKNWAKLNLKERKTLDNMIICFCCTI